MSKLTHNGKIVIRAFAPACSLCYDECEYCYYAEGCKGFNNPNLIPITVDEEIIELANNPCEQITLVYEGGEF